MAVVIRMKRTGRRNAPCYRISVADSRLPRDGRTLETLGTYDPISPLPELRVKLDVERAKHWISVGALPSHTVRSIFRREGVYEGKSEPPKRTRDGRGKDTSKRRRREERNKRFAEAKEQRRAEREAAKAAAKQAAAAEGGASAEA